MYLSDYTLLRDVGHSKQDIMASFGIDKDDATLLEYGYQCGKHGKVIGACRFTAEELKGGC